MIPRLAVCLLALSILALGLPTSAQTGAAPVWTPVDNGIAQPMLENVPARSNVGIETPLPDGSRPVWDADRTPVPRGFRLNGREGTDYLVLTVTSVVTGVIGVDGRHYVITGDAKEVQIQSVGNFDEVTPIPAPNQTDRIESDADGALDVLVLYTPSAAVAAGGSAAIEQSLSDYMVATQGYFDTSDAQVSASLAGIHAVSDTEASDMLRTLVELTFLEDSLEYIKYDSGADVEKFDEAQCRRGEADADVVVLVTGNDGTGTAGIAWILNENPAFRDFAFAASEWTAGAPTFAHEIGHLLGLAHDADNNPNNLGRFPYSQGYRVPDVARTIMAYPCTLDGLEPCPRIGIFSNPDIHDKGHAMGDPVTADAARSLSQTWSGYTGWGYNDPPALVSPSVTTDTSDLGRYVVSAEGRDTSSCSGLLRADPGDGRPSVTQTWESPAQAFEVEVDVRYSDPATVAVDVCLVDIQGLETCQELEVDVCHGSEMFTDIPTDSPFDEDIGWMGCQGVTTGFPDGTFRPNADIARQAMAAFMYRMAGAPEFIPPAEPTFADVGTPNPFFHEIEWLAAEEITTGYPDGTFRPNADITRQAMAAFLRRLSQLPSG